jgi:hypothetical protein
VRCDIYIYMCVCVYTYMSLTENNGNRPSICSRTQENQEKPVSRWQKPVHIKLRHYIYPLKHNFHVTNI